MKKITSLFVSTILLLSIIISSGIVFAQEDARLTVSDVEGEYGEEITVEVSICNSPGFGGMAYDVKYDNSVLKLLSYSLGHGSNICTDSGVDTYDDKVNFQYAGTSNVEGDGVLVTLVFEIIAENVDSTEIIVVPEEGTTFYYENRTEIDFTLEEVTGKVTVKSNNVPVVGVIVDEIMSLEIGQTMTLGYTVNPSNATNKTVSFESSDTSVAIVNETTGEVTGISDGIATVTVTTADGGFTDSCVVTVACKHAVKTCTDEKKATCKEGGWEAYCVCDTCGQIFTADGETELNAIPVTSVNKNNHVNVQSVPEDEATCVNQGHDAYEKCLDCGAITSGSDNMYYGDHNYGELIPATAEKHTATELKPAISAHYQCSLCEKYFTEDKDETSYEALVGETPSHEYGDTWYNDGTNHWKECDCGDKAEKTEHSYDNDYDTTCNDCGYTRTIEHDYGNTWYNDETNHWKECACGDKSEIGEHDYTDDCDTTCDTCGYTRTVEHDYGNTWHNDETNHWKECACGDKSEIGEHDYTDDSDATCNTCGYTRTVEHDYGDTWYNDETNHWKECACGDKSEIGEHDYTDDCDTTCDTCGYIRTIKHEYGNTWYNDETNHWKECACGDKAEISEHNYDDNCDESCNTCGYNRTVEHSYGDTWHKNQTQHWKECACGDVSEKGTHTYGDWVITEDATSTEPGEKEKECSVCGHKVVETIPATGSGDQEPQDPPSPPNHGNHGFFGIIGVIVCTIFKFFKMIFIH